MESHPKVMTVSYGTFSCTLEGFDDPFTTMQLVAEYFRKLAQGDRYFGGEPLQPDNNALHQIAKDANPYQVDAEVTESGITLRKADVVDAPEDEASVAAPAQTPAETPVKSAPAAEPVAVPVFSSRRRPSAKPAPIAEIEPDEGTDPADSFVAATIFTSRRGALDAAEDEPEQSAATLIRQAEEENDTPEQPIEIQEIAQAAPPVIEDAPEEVVQETIAEDDVAADEFQLIQEDTETADAETVSDELADDLETIKSRIADEIEDSAPTQDTAEETIQASPRQPEDDIQREEEALERLLETTNSKLDNPAHARKSNALERLKAAVAATEAERRLRAGTTRTERPKVQDLKVSTTEFKSKMGDVRRDHEEVVKMTRPSAKSGTKRARGTIATLILGNDQRVSSSDAAEAAAPAKKPEAEAPAQQPVAPQAQPRPALKIVRQNQAEPQNPARTASFEAFAKKIGANTLHELLEASAAYLAIVQDEPRFSQDRIVRNLGPFLSKNNVSADATNRSLHRLMRDGRILRVKHDSYTISKSARHGFQDRLVG